MAALALQTNTPTNTAALPLLYRPSEGRGPRTIVVHAGTLRRWLVGSAEYPAVIGNAAGDEEKETEGDGRWDEIDRYVERLPGDDNAPLQVLFLVSVFDDDLINEIMMTILFGPEPKRYPSIIKFGFHMQETMFLQSAWFQPWTLVVFVGDLAVTCVAFDEKGLPLRDTAKRVFGDLEEEQNAEQTTILRVVNIVRDALGLAGPDSDDSGEKAAASARPIRKILVRLPMNMADSRDAVQESLHAALQMDDMTITVRRISPVQNRECDSAMSGGILHWSLESHGVCIGIAGSQEEYLPSIYQTPFNWAIGKNSGSEVDTCLERNLVMEQEPYAIPEGSDRHTLFIH